MYKLKKKGSYLRVNLLGLGPPLIKKKRIYRAAVSQRLRNTALEDPKYEGWNFNSGNYLFTTDTK